MSLLSLLTSYRILSLQHHPIDKLRVEVELEEMVSVEELSQIAEWVRPHSGAERTNIFYGLRADPKPTAAWATS